MSTLEVESLVVSIIALAATILGLVPLYLDLMSRRKIDFKLLRFQEVTDKPVESVYSIRILHPNKPIEKCSVSYNGIKLPWSDKLSEPDYEKFIDRMSGGNVRIPKAIEKANATVVVRDGKRIIRKKKYQEIPIVPL
jgi:hypothetical protein